LPGQIESLEQKLKVLQEEVSQPDFYQQEQDVIQKRLREMQEMEQTLEETTERWLELEEQTSGKG
jgi:ABC transport system ATP-binding/permease protein